MTILSGGGLLVGGGGLLLTLRPQAVPDLLLWNSVAIVTAVSITVLVWTLVRSTGHALVASVLGWSTVFAHVLDAVTTGFGIELFGTVERNPVSASVISIGESLVVDGGGVFLFLLLKIVAALFVAWLATESVVEERDERGLLVLAGGAGLAPAVHNLVLFSLTVF